MKIEQQPRLPIDPRPIVCIGAGGIMRDAHLPAYRNSGFQVASVYDKDQGAAEKLAADFGIPGVHGSLAEAVEAAVKQNAVFDIATPASAIPGIVDALPDEAAALIQKPMGEDLEHAREIRDLCRRKKLTAAVNFQLRFAPCNAGARSLIDQGAIGEIHDMEINVNTHTPWHLWGWLAQVPRVEIVYHSIHYIDLIRSFLGDPAGVYAKTTRHPSSAHMEATRSSVILDYGDDVRAGVTTNHGHDFGGRHQWSYVKWEGTRGAVRTRIGVVLDYPRGRPDELEYCVVGEGGEREWITVEPEGNWYPDAFVGTMASLQCFLEGSAEELPTSIEDAFHTMAVVEAAYESSAGGGVKPRYGPAHP